MGSPHLGDIGTEFVITLVDQNGVAVDISGSTTKDMLFRDPGRNLITKPAGFVTDGADGKMKYVAAGDLNDDLGLWEIQAHVVGTGYDYHSAIGKYVVARNIS